MIMELPKMDTQVVILQMQLLLLPILQRLNNFQDHGVIVYAFRIHHPIRC